MGLSEGQLGPERFLLAWPKSLSKIDLKALTPDLRLDLLFSTTGPPQESASHHLLHFARVTFQFSARVLARKISAGMKAVTDRTFQGLVGPRAVLAGVAEKPPKS